MGIIKGKRGAVIAEFIIAFMPICAMFLCIAQLARYSIARLAVMHAAEVAVRACAVIYEPDPGHDKSIDGKDEDVLTAAQMVMKPYGGDMGGQEISIEAPKCTHAGEANGGQDKVTIDAKYTCTVPLARHIVCPPVGYKKFTKTAEFPHQGAEYKLE